MSGRTGTGTGTDAGSGGGGDPEIARVAAVFADPRRARVLMALADGRALPAGRLAEEAGVAASTVSNHLAILLNHGLVTARQEGRHRYYRLASADVEGVLEALARLAPRTPVTSLREHTKASALRTARTCYHHLAGRLGVRLLRQMLEADWVAGGDGLHHPGETEDRLSAPGLGTHYRLTGPGARALARFGVPGERARRTGPCVTASTGPSRPTTSRARSAPPSPAGCSSWTGSPGARCPGACG